MMPGLAILARGDLAEVWKYTPFSKDHSTDDIKKTAWSQN